VEAEVGIGRFKDQKHDAEIPTKNEVEETEVFLHFSCTTVQVLDYQWSG